ncbi:MAG: MATE family efflux transporter [Lachnospiraceae bacterium]|nr:MATE family efflux transporter [Lachnospiraceae bacterium]MDD7076680.1 MATE family efflux transporter [Lachnospiraceae bacterium]MDY3730848.1 MATE family efflux transporter [Candidatus Choladocola sp.]
MIYIALVLQNVVTLSVNLADNMMLGAYSEVSLSGVAAVNQIQFVYQQLLLALGDGLVIFCSQYWGKKMTGPMKRIAATAMQAGLLICALLFFLVSLFPVQALRLFTTDEAIIAEGVRYLGIIRFTYLFFAITQILLATLRSVEMVKIAFMLSVQTFFINCGINYVLIYGKFGAPELGVAGAAIGTLVARIVECIVLICYVRKKEKNLRIRLKDYLKFDKVLCVDYIKITAPMLLVQGLWGLNTAMQTVILGHMTAAAIAANSVASTLFLLVKSIPVGAASTASIMIGKKIGEGDLDVVKNYARVLQKMFVVIGIISGILLFFLRIPVLRLYDLSENTREMANTFLIILSIVAVGMSYQMPTNNGIIRGGGNAMFVVKMDIISIWGIVIPLSLIMAFVVKASPVVVVCCLNADQIFKCVPAFLEANYGKWIRKLTRDEI